jgi:hypothetical protein
MLDGTRARRLCRSVDDHFAQAHHELPRDTHSSSSFELRANGLGCRSVSWSKSWSDALFIPCLRRAHRSSKASSNVRGQLLLCVSLARLLQVSTAESESTARRPKTTFARLLVVRTESGPLVFPVSEVCGLWPVSGKPTCAPFPRRSPGAAENLPGRSCRGKQEPTAGAMLQPDNSLAFWMNNASFTQ